MKIRLTPLGTAMILLEIGSLRLLTDPVFDPAGGHYDFGWGTASDKLTAPALKADSVGRIDAVLLSHDQHEDNLDRAGRAFLSHAGQVITTEPGARRLKSHAIGLHPWKSTTLSAPEGLQIRITATPAQHGPLIFLPAIGAVIGFVLEWTGQTHGALYLSGDTVWFRGIPQIGARFKIGTAILHMGGARFPLYGPLRFTMNGSEAVRVAKLLNPQTLIPIHYEGWSHFKESREISDRVFQAAGLDDRVRWLPLGVPTEIDV
jgi:L-ascorbate metabolism protein UlaG (beta-lactamase superfamily)